MQDGNACVLDMRRSFYALPPVGAMMLRRVLETDLTTAASLVAAEFGVPIAQVQGDMRHFLKDLEDRDLLRQPGQPSRPQQIPRGARVVATLLALAFAARRSTQARAAWGLTLARLSLRLFGWTATVSAWKRRIEGPTREPAPVTPGTQAGAIDAIVRAAAARHVLGMDCKERALCCWAMAKRAGLPASLVVGIRPYPLAGHSWCEIDGVIVSDDRQSCARYTPVFRYA